MNAHAHAPRNVRIHAAKGLLIELITLPVGYSPFPLITNPCAGTTAAATMPATVFITRLVDSDEIGASSVSRQNKIIYIFSRSLMPEMVNGQPRQWRP